MVPLLPIGGDLLHSLFGTTTDDDLRPIKEHISRIAKEISHLGHGLQIQQHQFTSFVQIAADRMEAFSNITVNHEHALGELRDRLRILFDTQAQDQQRLIAAIQHLQQFVNQMQHIDELRQSIESLLHGNLTPQLISKVTLRSTLLGIKSEVERRLRKSHLVFKHATDFTPCTIFILADTTTTSSSCCKCQSLHSTISFKFSRSQSSQFS